MEARLLSRVSILAAVSAAALLAGCGYKDGGFLPDPVVVTNRIVIFAPHPDDETLGCAGVIVQALAGGHRVKVVVMTNGDANWAAAMLVSGKTIYELKAGDYIELARVRQEEELDAMSALGLPPSDVVFLGYPDGGLASVFATGPADPAYVQAGYTWKAETYGVARSDYHSEKYGVPAPYKRQSVISDISGILREFDANMVYVTDGHDFHPDHSAACSFVVDACVEAGITNAFRTYLVHADGITWPYPSGPTPDQPFSAETLIDGQWLVPGLRWPPPVRVPLDSATVGIKMNAIARHWTQIESGGQENYLDSFVKNEEVFWTP